MVQHLILGNGIAAISAVRAIRSISPRDRITIVSNEAYPAYSPTLITYYLKGKIGFKDLFICDKAFYRDNGVDLRLGSAITGVKTDRRKVFLDDGRFLDYDNLLIATGARPAIPPIDGARSPGVFTLYTADDAKRVVRFLKTRKHVAVIGGGLVGLQTVGALMSAGKKATLVEMKDRILPQTLNAEGAAILQEALRQGGVDVHLRQGISAINHGRGKITVSLKSGLEIVSEAVVLATGTRPNVEFLEGSGIGMANGIVVDEFCRTNIDHVYAAGDLAQTRDEITGGLVSNPSWPSAVKQGRTAGLNMAGKQGPIQGNIRFNAFTVAGLACVSMGSIDSVDGPPEEALYRDELVYRKLFFRNGLPVGAVLMGDVEDAGVIANMINLRDSALAVRACGSVKALKSDRDYYRSMKQLPVISDRARIAP